MEVARNPEEWKFPIPMRGSEDEAADGIGETALVPDPHEG